MQTLTHLVTHYGYAGIFILLVLGIVGLPIPDESLLAFAGYLVAEGKLRLPWTAASAFLGSCCGITLSYLLGRLLGRQILSGHLSLLHINRENIERTRRWFERVGRWALTLGYFIPGIRHLTALTAGTSKLDSAVFARFAYTGALLWSLSFISLGYWFGRNWEAALGKVRVPLIVAAIVIFAAVVLYFRSQRKRRARN